MAKLVKPRIKLGKWKYKISILFFKALLVGCTLPLHSLKGQEITHQESYWIRTYFQWKHHKKWIIHLELDERRLIAPDRQLQLIAHAHLHRKLSENGEISAGTSFSWVNEVPEARLFQEFHWYIPFTKHFKMANRFRTEQRCFFLPENQVDFKYRWRYRGQLSYQFLPGLVLKGSEEILIQGNQFDQNRIYGAVEYQFRALWRGRHLDAGKRSPKTLGLEAGYLKIIQNRQPSGLFNRDILRVTLYYYV